MMPLRLAEGCPQCIDTFGQQLKPTIRQIDREKETASGNKIAAVAGHANILAS
jgi:hypothetical protein